MSEYYDETEPTMQAMQPRQGQPQAQGNGNTGMTVRPQQVGVAAEQQRAVAEIQAALTVAKADPRNEMRAVDRIRNACQRQGLAERAEYVYSRGGTDITGPTIDLLSVIATCWGNMSFGFRELTQQDRESSVEAFAWDLESNTKRTVVFTVPHSRVARGKTTRLSDPRDIYEAVANQAQRRVRACLEAIIPPDVVDDAVEQCRATLAETAAVTPESVAKMLTTFGQLGVTKEQIEKRLSRRVESMQPAQLVNLRRIFKSVKDGMSKTSDWFEVAEEAKPQSGVEAAKDALRKATEAGGGAGGSHTIVSGTIVSGGSVPPVADVNAPHTADQSKLVHRLSQGIDADEWELICGEEGVLPSLAGATWQQAENLLQRLKARA